MTRRRRFSLLAVVLPLVLFLGACANDAPQDTLEPKGPIAREIDNLVNPVFLVAAVVFVLVEVGVLLMAWRFRRRKDEDDDAELPEQIHGNTKLEIAWTAVPALILLGVAIPTVFTIFSISERPADALTVRVTGQQWWWDFRYDTDGNGEVNDDDELITANDLVIPAGQPVELDIRSNDVIHSFWIPALNGKKDAVPGRQQDLVIEADEPGTYVGQCTEFCGLSHAYMRQRVIALDEADYQAWFENQLDDAEPPTENLAEQGAELFASSCSRCHLAEGINDDQFEEQGSGDELVSGNAPNLTHLMSRGVFAGATFDLWVDQNGDDIVEADEIGADNGGEVNRTQLEAWLRDPPGEKPMMPDRRGMPDLNLSEDQIDQLVAFLETLE